MQSKKFKSSFFMTLILLFACMLSVITPLHVYAGDDLDVKITELEAQLGRVQSAADTFFTPSDDLKQYASTNIHFDTPTSIPEYNSQTEFHLPTAQESKEYIIKAASEGQPGVVLYGDKGYADRIIKEVVYAASYGIYLKHLSNWHIVSEELVDVSKDIYRYVVTFDYLVPRSHLIEMEKRISIIAEKINEMAEKMEIPQSVINANHLDEKAQMDLKKTFLVHDYITKFVKPHYEETFGQTSYIGSTLSEVHSMNAAIFENRAVCQGYTLFFERLSDHVGLDTRMVRAAKGTALLYDDNSRYGYKNALESAFRLAKKGGRWGMDEGGANHAWNQVKIGENWYHVDVSGDATMVHPMYYDEKDQVKFAPPQEYRYKYFLKTDAEMSVPEKDKYPVDESGKLGTLTVYRIWLANESYATPVQPLDLSGMVYQYIKDGGLGGNPIMNISYQREYPLGRMYNAADGKIDFEEPNLTENIQTRYQISVPAFDNTTKVIPVKQGVSDIKLALKEAGVTGFEFTDGTRHEKGYVNTGHITVKEVEFDETKNQQEIDRFLKNHMTVGTKLALTVFVGEGNQKVEKDIVLEIAGESEFRSDLTIALKEGKENKISIPQFLADPSDQLGNENGRAAKIGEIDALIKEAVIAQEGDVVLEGSSIPADRIKMQWAASGMTDHVVDQYTSENELIRTVLIKGNDDKWTTMDFYITLTKVERPKSAYFTCKHKKTKEVLDGNFEKEVHDDADKRANIDSYFYKKFGADIRGWYTRSGSFPGNLTPKIYLIDNETGKPRYWIKEKSKGKFFEIDENGEYTKPVTDFDVESLIMTEGVHQFLYSIKSDLDEGPVTRIFTLTVYDQAKRDLLENFKLDLDGGIELADQLEKAEQELKEKLAQEKEEVKKLAAAQEYAIEQIESVTEVTSERLTQITEEINQAETAEQVEKILTDLRLYIAEQKAAAVLKAAKEQALEKLSAIADIPQQQLQELTIAINGSDTVEAIEKLLSDYQNAVEEQQAEARRKAEEAAQNERARIEAEEVEKNRQKSVTYTTNTTATTIFAGDNQVPMIGGFDRDEMKNISNKLADEQAGKVTASKDEKDTSANSGTKDADQSEQLEKENMTVKSSFNYAYLLLAVIPLGGIVAFWQFKKKSVK